MIQNHEGSFSAAYVKKFANVHFLMHAEMLVAREAALFALHQGGSKCIFEGDAKVWSGFIFFGHCG